MLLHVNDPKEQATEHDSRHWSHWLVVVLFTAILLSLPFIFLTDFPAHRLNLTSVENRADLEKWVGVVPQSGVAYRYVAGFVDTTLFYKLRVTGQEAASIIDYGFQPSPRYSAPRHAPHWWRPHIQTTTKYFATDSTFPNRCVYNPDSGWIYLQIEL